MVFLDVHVGTLEHSVGVAVRTNAEVLLAKAPNLRLNGNGLLRRESISIVSGALGTSNTYKLLGERHLLELHLVDSGLGGAEQHRCANQSSFHDGQLQ